LIAVSEREYFAARTGGSDERIVGGNSAVLGQAQDFSIHVVVRLRFVAERRAGRHVDKAVRRECQSRAALAGYRFAFEQNLGLRKLSLRIACPRECRYRSRLAVRIRRAGRIVGVVDQSIAAKVRMDGDFVHAAIASRSARWSATDRRIDQSRFAADAGCVTHQTQADAAFGYQRVTRRQKGKAERPREAVSDDLDSDTVLFGRFEFERSLRKVGGREAQIRWLRLGHRHGDQHRNGQRHASADGSCGQIRYFLH
jgi:hypothetical protein